MLYFYTIVFSSNNNFSAFLGWEREQVPLKTGAKQENRCSTQYLCKILLIGFYNIKQLV